jgi:hypothetical protein
LSVVEEIDGGEERRQAGVEVADAVPTVSEELLGGAKLGVGLRGSGNNGRRPALARSSRWSEEQNGGECGVEVVVARHRGRKGGFALTPVRLNRR